MANDPVPWSAIQNGPVFENAIPHGFTRFGLETTLCCTYAFAACKEPDKAANATISTMKKLRIRRAAKHVHCRTLVNQFQSELNLARREGGSDLSERRVVGYVIRIAKVRVLQNIEEFRPELQGHSLSDAEALVRGQVRLFEAGCAERIAPGGFKER